MAVKDALIIGLPIVLALVTIPLSFYVRRRIAAQIRAGLPASPLQVLERRLASGEISAEEYQYERYLLEKGG